MGEGSDWGLIPFKSGMELLYNLALLTKQTLCRGICTFLCRIWLLMALRASFEVIHRGPAGKQAQSSADNRQRIRQKNVCIFKSLELLFYIYEQNTRPWS